MRSGGSGGVAALMRDLQLASGAIAAATDAVKLNHEIHANTVPHLHVHITHSHSDE
jgi:diadenosine tetraphosphate (Ap4A) HIT family hydrolase